MAVDAFVKDIPLDATHPSWSALAAVASGLEQLRDNPALIVWGGKDVCFHDWYFAEWRRCLPQAEAHHLADAGHYVLADANAEAVPLIARFLGC